jgi:hypothetical protein
LTSIPPVDFFFHCRYADEVPKKNPPQKKQLPPEVLEFFKKAGAKGGKLGAKKRWDGVSAEARTALAKKAVAAREAKRQAR